jgi:hypothetical protein
MVDVTPPDTGATHHELVDLASRIAERGLQLKHVGSHRAEPLSDYEATMIRMALLTLAQSIGGKRDG